MADGKLADVAGQLGNGVQHSNYSQPKVPGTQPKSQSRRITLYTRRKFEPASAAARARKLGRRGGFFVAEQSEVTGKFPDSDRKTTGRSLFVLTSCAALRTRDLLQGLSGFSQTVGSRHLFAIIPMVWLGL